jgi:uncharacterized membrane protein YbhN (UPF0104 family)
MRRPRKVALTLVSVAVAVGCFYALARHLDFVHAFRLIRAAGWAMTWLIVPFAVSMAIGALPWAWLLPPALRPSWEAIVSGRFAATSLNAVLPAGLAGEPVRLRSIPSGRRWVAGEALVTDRGTYLLGNAAFIATTSILGAEAGGGATFAAAAISTAVGLTAAGLMLLGAVHVPHLRRLFHRVLPQHVREGQLTEHRPRAPLPLMLLCFTTHYLSRIASSFEVLVGAWLVGVSLSFDGWMLVSGALAVSGTLPLTPGALGVQEAAVAAAFAGSGADPAAGLAFALMLRLRQLLFIPLGLSLVGSPWMAPMEAKT